MPRCPFPAVGMLVLPTDRDVFIVGDLCRRTVPELSAGP